MGEQFQTILNEGAKLQAKLNEALTATGEESLSPAGRERLMKLKADLKAFRTQMSSPQELCDQVPVWKTLVGDEAALVAAQILFAFHREKRLIKPSDGIYFMHAMYLPHSDLWRGDRAFSDLLIKHGVNFSERVVPTLLDLPGRIEAEIVKSGATSEQ